MKRLTWLFILLVLLSAGCGRKLDPLPPGEGAPVKVLGVRYENGGVRARVLCSEPAGRITLVGKPQGICPACTDDLVEVSSLEVSGRGVLSLVDVQPQAACMVYRVRWEHGESGWLSAPRIVCRDKN